VLFAGAVNDTVGAVVSAGGGGGVDGLLVALPGKVPAFISVILENVSPSESAFCSAAVNAWLAPAYAVPNALRAPPEVP